MVWWCVPRFDSPSVFAGLLDDRAGHFTIRPAGIADVTRIYRPESLVLETRFVCDDGELVLSDALAMAPGVRGHDLGRDSPHMLLRNARCVRGGVDVEVEFVPRTEYVLSTPVVSRTGREIAAGSGPVTLMLDTDFDLEINEARDGASGTAKLLSGDEIAFAVRYGSSWAPAPEPIEPGSVSAAIDDTAEAWRSWAAEHQRYDGPYADEVHLAGRVLQGLTYVPTGAIVAAPTTSLPETPGGARNWDYRFSWVRDASFTLDALWVAACPDEEHHYFRFLTTAASSVYHRDQLQVVFGIQGERILNEHELPWLRGWHDSRPVRGGQRGLEPTSKRRLWGAARRRLHALASDPVGLALDRAVEMSPGLDEGDRVDHWRSKRDEIREVILERAWNDDVGAFTQSFGSSHLDAAALVIPIVGFLPPDDSRVSSTVRAIEADLTDESGLVARYRGPDGLRGDQGAFLLCTFWLAQAHALAGNTARAREVFTTAAGFANDLGLLSEEVDPGTGSLLGNFPQALSYIGLVNAAWAIGEAERSQG